MRPKPTGSRAVETAPRKRSRTVPAARFVAPRVGARTIRREGLVARIDDASTPVVAVVAPAGYGKTSVLAEWTASSPRSVAWLTLDASHNDPVVLAQDLARATAFGTSAAIDEAFSAPVEAEAVTFAWSMADPRPSALVVDRLESLTDTRAQALIAEVVLSVPEDVTLVLTSQRGLPFDTARLIADGRLTIIDKDALSLETREIDAFLGASGIHLARSDVGLLHRRTEGWPAGLRLASAWLANTSHDVAKLAGGVTLISDYFQAEVLPGSSPKDVEFLIRTSVLDRLSGPVCDEMLETHGAWKTLERLERSSMFLWSDDDQRTWFRLHPLFREMLRAELDRREPMIVPQMLARAAAWCEDNGYIEDAARYAREAEDEERVLRIVRVNAQGMFQAGKGEVVQEWLSWLQSRVPPVRFGADAVLAVWTHAMLGDSAEVDRWYETIRRLPHAVRAPDGSGSLRSWIALADALLCRDGVDKMRDDAEAALRDLSPSSSWYPVALLHVGAARLLLGDLDAADDVLTDAVDECERAGTVNAGIVAWCERAWIAVRRGDPDHARELARRAASIREEHHLGAYATGALSSAMSARVELLDANLPMASSSWRRRTAADPRSLPRSRGSRCRR
jgi:LuxR family transcriptional regulator, maltose regulon positive regulatory protein